MLWINEYFTEILTAVLKAEIAINGYRHLTVPRSAITTETNSGKL